MGLFHKPMRFCESWCERTLLCQVNSRSSQKWHVDETYIRGGGKWRYLWRAIDVNGQLVDFSLTARRDAKASLDLHRHGTHISLDDPRNKPPVCPAL
ncbi:MAG: DDE-type integrase/transposase/recombinase [Pseudoruegeria sp.]